eukprot:COSAG06_NODE_51550_length_311_cov_0.952830_1_plen_25_part_10
MPVVVWMLRVFTLDVALTTQPDSTG